MEKNIDGYTRNNRVTLVRGGKQYFDQLIHLISCAEETVHLQTYIFAEDETGQLITDALIKACHRGVKVFLMVDGYASQGLSRQFIERIKKQGIKFKYFEPLFKSSRFYLGRRLHHKLCVVDMRNALVGGINIANHYNDIDKPAWLDFALSVEGEVVQELLVLCQKTWNGFQSIAKIPIPRSVPFFMIPDDVKSYVRMRRNDWVRRKNQIASSYIEMFNSAKSEILILCSYFLPGSVFRKAMRLAAERGVKITVILAGVSDVKTAKLAERYMYEWLLRRDITIYEYNETILHGKLSICDREWLTLGSFNVNDISTYASVELNLDVADPRFARDTYEYLQQNIINKSTLVSESYLSEHSTLIQHFLRWGSFVISRFLVFFFTFYFKQVKETESLS